MKIKVCPRCGSENIEWIIPQNWSMWECYDCEYTGAIIEVDKEVQEEIQKKWKNNPHKNKSHIDNEYDDLSDEEFDKKLDKLFYK